MAPRAVCALIHSSWEYVMSRGKGETKVADQLNYPGGPKGIPRVLKRGSGGRRGRVRVPQREKAHSQAWLCRWREGRGATHHRSPQRLEKGRYGFPHPPQSPAGTRSADSPIFVG